MKKVFLLLSLVCVTCGAVAQEHFSLSGNFVNVPANANVAIAYTLPNGNRKVDSCMLNNGDFNFSGIFSGTQMIYMTTYTGKFEMAGDDQPNVVNIFVDPGKVVVDGDFRNLKGLTVNGSHSQKEFELLDARYKAIQTRAQPALAVYRKLNEAYTLAKKDSTQKKLQDSLQSQMHFVENQFEQFSNEFTKNGISFIKSHPNSYVSAFQLLVYSSRLPIDTIKNYYGHFTSQIKNSTYGKEIRKNIDAAEASTIGKPAFAFATVDINGKSIALADFKNKYVLLDFWASWCVPCRESTPHLLETYKKYHSKGMEVIAIADDDRTRGAWKKAVAADGTFVWHNVLRGMVVTKKGMDVTNSISDKYGVQVLPTKVLINPEGIIIGRYRGVEDAAALDKKLEEVLGN
ncbi:DUF4369 domain-containing protein [Mucilaginibacter terrenus]|uniref:DUF4369 domain-containing protein n=1 Tax=Mucilaginibacter terrenus TaxID=2482727 RepID=A0A3E2NMA6_9SPHI|nr:AhpC/TSA family protein [Mucilaginibacter terrenus]RFZ82108.1 DUF4369 domain-containing protein [Mucilaginibacter terrenus]